MKKISGIPFSGSKRNYVKDVVGISEDFETIYDVFGGSLILSANIKNNYSEKNVIGNDYDKLFTNFSDIIDFREEHFEKIKHLPRINNKKLDANCVDELQSIISNYTQKQLMAIKHNHCFSGITTPKLRDFVYFHNNSNRGKYLEHFENIKKLNVVENLDCFEFIEKYKNDDEKTLWLIDPPYLNSSTKQYSNNFSGIKMNVELLKSLVNLQGTVMFFTMNVEDSIAILELFDYFEIIEIVEKKVASQKNSVRHDGCIVFKKKRKKLLTINY